MKNGRIFTRLTAALLGLSLLSACAQDAGQKQQVGTLLGAGLGALAGAQIGGGKGRLAAVALGTLAGAYMGGEVGKSLDKADRMQLQRTTQDSLEYNKTGQASSWSNPDSGHGGTVTPTRTVQTADNTPCREFESTVRIDGREETATGTACRQPDGSWRVVQ